MNFSIDENREPKMPEWCTTELVQAILGTEGTASTVVLHTSCDDLNRMDGKIRAYIVRKYGKQLRTKRDGKEGTLRVWVPTEMEIKDEKSARARYSSKRGGDDGLSRIPQDSQVVSGGGDN